MVVSKDETRIRDVRYSGLARPKADSSFRVSAEMDGSPEPIITLVIETKKGHRIPIEMDKRLPIGALPAMSIDSKLVLGVMSGEVGRQALERMIEIIAATVARLEIRAEEDRIALTLTVGKHCIGTVVDPIVLQKSVAIAEAREVAAA
ncbi:MAG: hypothetical protein V1745_00535 [Patescibacteria group bacterium]